MKNKLARIIIIAFLFVIAPYSEVCAESTAGIAVTVTVEHIEQVAGVRILVFPRFRWVRPGQTVNLWAIVSNRGNGDDYFKLTATSSLGWSVEFPQGDTLGPIKPGRRKAIRIRVIVPVDARRGQRDRVTITATSQFDTTVSDQGSTTITVRRTRGLASLSTQP